MNDWASAVGLGVAKEFHGALQFAANEILDQLPAENYKAKAEHDLGTPCRMLLPLPLILAAEMLVKMIYSLVLHLYYRKYIPPYPRDPQQWPSWGTTASRCWSKLLSLQPWVNLLNAARNKDYERLRDLILLTVPSKLIKD